MRAGEFARSAGGRLIRHSKGISMAGGPPDNDGNLPFQS